MDSEGTGIYYSNIIVLSIYGEILYYYEGVASYVDIIFG